LENFWEIDPHGGRTIGNIEQREKRVVSTDPGWEDEHRPTNPVLMKIYRF
jgi:hypothetical protein